MGIEIPGLPADLGAIGDSAGTAVASATELVSGVGDGATAVTDGLAGSAGATETASTAGDSATQVLADITGSVEANPQK